MIIFRSLAYVIVFVLSLSGTVQALPDSPSYKALSFTRLDVEGLDSLSTIVAIEQDSHGFIWFGGKNGVVRYDGYEALDFRYQPDQPHGIGSNDVSDLHLDSRGQLWLAMLSGGGLSRYDDSSRKFIHYYLDKDISGSIGSNSIYAIAEDADGNLWLATHGAGLSKFDQASKVFTRYTFDPSDMDSISDNIVRDLAIDQDGFIWLATASGGLNRFDPRTETFKLFLHDGSVNSLSENELNKVFIDSNNNIWVGTLSTGVNVLLSGTESFIRFENQNDNDMSIGRGMIWDIGEDEFGSIWIASGNGDLNVYNIQNNSFQRIKYTLYNAKNASSSPTSIFFDKAGDMWVGSYFSSVDYLNLSATKFSPLDMGKVEDIRNWPRNITAITIDQQRKLWMATDKGLASYNLATAELYYISVSKGSQDNVSDYPIRALMTDRDNNIWIGSFGGGVSVLEQSTNTISRVNLGAGLRGNKVWALHQDPFGDIWIGTQTRGLIKYSPTDKSFDYIIADENDPSKLISPFIWDIHTDREHNLWLATQRGAVRIDLKSGELKSFVSIHKDRHSISSNSVRAIAEDKHGTLWFATDSGLNRYNKDKQQFVSYRIKDGLVDDNISDLTFDNKGHLWFSTQKGLSRLNPVDLTFDHYDYRNGVVGRSFPRRAMVAGKNGNIFAGNSMGVTFIDPNIEERNDFIPTVLITGVRLSNQALEVGSDSPLKKEAFYTDSIELRSDYSLITFEFAALSYYISSQNQYAYKLEGFDKDWHNADSSERRAVYTNLDPGEYTFYVKGSNNDGLWNNTPAQLTINIPPPWYLKWWARTIIAISVALMVYGYFAWRLRLNAKRQIWLQKRVNEKTQELADANDAIKELNFELEERVAQRTNELSIEVEERRQAEEKLFHMAFHDALTGLPNRYWLVQELKARIEKLKSTPGFRFALLFLDGDRFKQINDTHGHLLGDKLLVSVGIRLKKILAEKHHVVRLGGDEFTILIDDVDDINSVKQTATLIVSAFERPFYAEQNKIFFKVSIGMVLCEEFYAKPEHILRDADIALYRAKDKGKGTFQIFDAKMREETIEASVLENDLHTAINKDELFLEFQPIVNLEDGALAGFEALLRWMHPEKGVICPDKFIPIAEESGLITKVGLIAFDKACKQLAQWRQAYNLVSPLIMSVNLSSLQLNQPDLIERIDDILERYAIDGKWIKLEITESALMDQTEAVNTLLDSVRKRGMVLAIDDFGTGYSSLSYLDQLPVQVLKIDRSFVNGITASYGDGAGAMEIVRATISLAHNLRMYVVAEGIESEEQLNILLASGCDYGQGYWIAEPLPEAEASRMIANNQGAGGMFKSITQATHFVGKHQRSRLR